MSPVFVSGATGYIGGAILRALVAGNIPVQGGIRQATVLPPGVTPVVTGDLARPGFTLPAVSTVVHAAGLGHQRGVPAAVWRAANVDAATNLATAAKRAGAEKFVLISTAHIHGRVHEGVVTDDSLPNPMDDYAGAKLQAEREVAAIFGAGLTIIRPVAVIGPCCPGNIPLLLKLLKTGIPLPFGTIRNQRAFIDVSDLARLVLAVLKAAVPPMTILAAHPEPISTPELIRALGEGMGKAARLFPFPPACIAAASRATGRAAMWQSLAGSFVAAPNAAIALGWMPQKTLRESLGETARYHDTTASTP